MRRSYRETIDRLPPPRRESLLPVIREDFAGANSTLIVMDDDPTGCQTVHDIPILTAWPVEALQAEFERSPAFFILTNSRSLPARDAIALNRQVARNIVEAATASGRRFMIISRSDSTLRGHFKAEIETLTSEFGWQDAVKLCIPAFFEGGRFTINDVHYVKEGDDLVPAAETPYAKDPSFGFSSSNLKEYICEKMGGVVQSKDICSVSLEDIREGGAESVAAKLVGCRDGSFCVINACERSDIEVVALAVYGAMEQGKRFLFRTAAAIIPALIGQEPRPLIGAKEFSPSRGGCGLIVVGSFVPMSSRQFTHLMEHGGVSSVELRVGQLLSGDGKGEIARVASEANRSLAENCDTVIYTSRELAAGGTSEENLKIQADVADALVEIVRGISTAPRYILAKGGITSNDIAAKALDVRRAVVLGQIIPGVPAWRLGKGSRFSGMNYIVFPGNVGGPASLTDVVRTLRCI
jgi:uncharacterized protein YgbK (DUF1537 family)